MKFLFFPLLLFVFAFSNISCSVYKTLINLSRLQFKLGDVNNFSVNGVSFSNKKSLNDFSAAEIFKLTSSITNENLPVSFNLNVQAKNPNDGTAGYSKTNATIKSFPWRLFIDDRQTITGNIAAPVTGPGTGEITKIPIIINLDLLKFFEDKGFESLLNLALNIGGYSGSSSKLTLYAQPTITTAIGDIPYPEEIKIVNLEFTK